MTKRKQPDNQRDYNDLAANVRGVPVAVKQPIKQAGASELVRALAQGVGLDAAGGKAR